MSPNQNEHYGEAYILRVAQNRHERHSGILPHSRKTVHQLRTAGVTQHMELSGDTLRHHWGTPHASGSRRAKVKVRVSRAAASGPKDRASALLGGRRANGIPGSENRAGSKTGRGGEKQGCRAVVWRSQSSCARRQLIAEGGVAGAMASMNGIARSGSVQCGGV